MVAVRGFHIGIYPEAFLRSIVVHLHSLAVPVIVAFDAEVVVALPCKGGLTGIRLQKSLGKGNACRNSGALHFLYCQGRVFVDVVYPGVVARPYGEQGRTQYQK